MRSDGTPTCALCPDEPVATHLLHVDHRAGDGVAWASTTPICSDCLALLDQGDLAGLDARTGYGPDALAVLAGRRSATRPVPPRRPEIEELLAGGFLPLHSLTGAGSSLAQLWPADHLAVLPPEVEPDEDQRLYARSPWPVLSLADVLDRLWAHADASAPRGPAAWEAALREALAVLAAEHGG